MQIDPAQAARTLNSVDKQLKKLADDALSKTESQGNPLEDVIDLGSNIRSGQTSAAFNQLTSELSAELQPLLSLIGDSTARQGELQDLFGDPAQADEVQARAQELLDTYFNVENTGNRIFDFAFSFYTPDQDRETYAREKQELIYEGFRQAEKALGGLADISLETRDYIDERIENFINEGKPVAAETEPAEAQTF